MIYDEQVDRFLSSVPNTNPNAKTKTQKLLVLLKHPETVIRENSLMCFTSALCQAKNRDAGREENLIPLFLGFLKKPPSPIYQKQSSYIVQSLAYNDTNKDVIRDANGIATIVSVLDQQKLANQEVSMNCITTLLLLLSNATNREIIAETENIKVFISCLVEGISMQVQEKTLSLLHNLTVAKTGKNSLREGGALPYMAMFMESTKPNIRETAIKTLYNLTGTIENRDAIRAHLLPSLLQQLDLPLPQNESTVLVAIKILSNLAFDRNAKDVVAKKEWFPHLVHVLSSDNVNCITNALVCTQNLINDENSMDSLFKAGGLTAVYNLAQRYQAQIALLQKIILILAELLVLDEAHKPFVEANGLDFLLPLLSSPDQEIQRAAVRGVSNLAIYYDEIRRQLCERGCANTVIDLILHSSDRETIRRASMALVSLALNYNNPLLVFKSGILQKLLIQLNERSDKELTILAAKILVNLTTNERIRKVVSEAGGIASSLDMLASVDEDYKLQGAKLVANLAISGSNRKAMHDRGLVANLRNMSKRVMEDSPTLKTQIEIALDNCAFPYEQRYEDLDFVVEEKMPQLAQDEEDEEDEDQRKERIQLEEEEHNLKVLEEKENFARQLREIEKEKQALAQKEEEERKRQEQQEKLRQEAAERKEAERKREEEEKLRADTLRRRRTDTERLKQMEAEVRKREQEMNRKYTEDKAARDAREKKEKEERDKREFDGKHKTEKRTKLIHDILQIERNYVNVLNLLIKKYLNPLQSSAKSQRPIIPTDKIKTIFSIVEVIFNYHQLLLDTLESRFKRWIADNMALPLLIGDIFIRMTDYMSCYSSYINNYNASLQTINECRKTNPGFLQFLKRVESDPEVRNQEIESFIITPVQQLPRYVMLLNDLLRNTPIEHPDHGSLSSAVEKFRRLTSFVNEQKREAEDAAAIVQIQTNMRGKFPSLLVPYRKFIKEGYLNFGENGLIRSKEGYTFLFNDLLVFTIKSTSKLEYTYKEELKLDPNANFKLENLKDDAKYKNGFLLKGTKSYTLLARTPVDKIAWMDAIKGAMSNVPKR
eukprot:Phypoly_transcript_01535.p1 GENE.Phypoly_transcript_01535~~Phypoly_transcript_01535.p1  ORF type:complete len:1058 (+),score=191.57 Phypoly_transcript_01535:98-3271(+)